MKSDRKKNSDEQFYSLLAPLKRVAISPDDAFLNELKERSANEFEANVSGVSVDAQASANTIGV